MEEDDRRTVCRLSRNPLENHIVIRKIFSFLNLQDTKIGRLVCRSWKDVADTLVGKRSKVEFLAGWWENEAELKSPADFLSRICKTGSRIEFTSFLFGYSSGGGEFSLTNVAEILKYVRKYILELTLTNVVFLNEDGVKISSFDISPLISEKHLTKLNISGSGSTIVIQLKMLPTCIKSLTLCSCTLDIENNFSKISPVEIYVVAVKVRKNGNQLENILLNELIDFQKMKKIILHGERERSCTAIILDVQGDVKVELLVLYDMDVLNMSSSQWKVDEMRLDGMNFRNRTSMNIRVMNFSGYSGGTIDLSALPQSIEKFSIFISPFSDTSVINCTRPLSLSNLKTIYLAFCAEAISYFANCQNLTDIYLKDMNRYPIGLRSLPMFARKLKLINVLIVGEENNIQIMELDQLILLKYSFLETDKMLTILKPKQLALQWTNEETFEINDSVVPFLNKNKQVENIIVGPFSWTSQQSFDNSQLSSLVSKKAEYYDFALRADVVNSDLPTKKCYNYNGVELTLQQEKSLFFV